VIDVPVVTVKLLPVLNPPAPPPPPPAPPPPPPATIKYSSVYPVKSDVQAVPVYTSIAEVEVFHPICPVAGLAGRVLVVQVGNDTPVVPSRIILIVFPYTVNVPLEVKV